MSLINKEKLQEFWTYASTWITARFVAKEDGKGLSTNDYTTTEKNKLAGIATGANKYTLPTAGSALGGVKTTSTVTDASGYTAAPIIDGVPYYKDTNTTYSNMKAATSSAAGIAGLVPAPAAGAQAKFLRGDGTWQTPANTTYSDMKGATTDAAGTHGLVPAPAAGAQAKFLRGDGTWQTPTDTKYTHPTTSGYKHIPAGGASGQILRWSADGTAVWGSDYEPDIITSEEIAAMFA